MLRSPRPDRVERAKVDGQKAEVEIYHTDPDYYTRIEVERDEFWEFGIDEEGVAELVETSNAEDDLVTEPELPEWLVETLYGIGISEIEGNAEVAL
ncbi:hypothetical protein [Halosimplex amylolyticum]|uniref:hypothetical protein n=1 Tax=Halosimplex amylolyticum TaxID=3396616 RepID=UPI003F55B47A